MKRLLDENLSHRIVPFLEQDCPGSTQVALIGMERSSVEAVWRYAVVCGGGCPLVHLFLMSVMRCGLAPPGFPLGANP